MKKQFTLGGGVFAAVMVLALIPAFVGCRQPATGGVPTVTGVTVTRITELDERSHSRLVEDADLLDAADLVRRGTMAHFRASVIGENNPPQAVNWYIAEANRQSGTRINVAGVLRVAANERLESITVGARSIFDSRRYGHITVYLYGEIADEDTEPEILESPRISLTGSVVSWDEVPGAGGYSLRIGGVEVPGGSLGRNARSFDLADLRLLAGRHVVTLVAIGVPGESLDSPPSNYEVYEIPVYQPGLPQLSAPVLSRIGFVISWPAVSGAGGYSLRIGGVEVPGGDLGPGITSFDLSGLALPPGDHPVTVVAVGVPGESLSSPESNTITYTVPADAQPGLSQLDPPEISIEGSRVSWNAVSGAGGFSLRVGGVEVRGGNFGPDTTGFDLAGLGLPPGVHHVTVVALGVPGQSLNSPASNTETFTVADDAPPVIPLPQLPAPDIAIVGATVEWEAVAGAGGYSVRIGGIEVASIPHTQTSFGLAGLMLPMGAHSVTVVALGVPGQSLNSPASNAVTFYVIMATGITVTVTVPDLRDMAGYIEIQGPSFSMTDAQPGQIVFDGGPHNVTDVEWRAGENPAPAGTFATTGNVHTLTLDSRIHGNREGTHRVTLEVVIGGVLYSRVIAFTVRL